MALFQIFLISAFNWCVHSCHQKKNEIKSKTARPSLYNVPCITVKRYKLTDQFA